MLKFLQYGYSQLNIAKENQRYKTEELRENKPAREAEYMMAIKCCLHGLILDLQTLFEFKRQSNLVHQRNIQSMID